MAGMFGGNMPASTAPTKYNQLQLQTSTLGLVIPVGWGKNRWTPNIIWYGNFDAEPADKGGKGGGKSGSYTYTAAVILALGEGPIQSIEQVWADQGTSTLGSLNLNLYLGEENQTPPGWMTDNYPAQALSYGYTAYLFSELYSLGNAGTLPDATFEVVGKYSGDIAGIPDASLGMIIPDMISNPQYGLDSGASYIDTATLENFDQYQRAQGIFVSPYLNRSEKAISVLQRWAQLGNTWIFWSGLSLKFHPLGDQKLTGNGGSFTPNTTPIFDFSEDDFKLDGENTLEIDIIDPWEGYNHFELDFTERSQQYSINPIYWEDQTSVDQYGQLQSQIISASEVCSGAIGQVITQLIGKRSTYIRRNPKWQTVNMLAAALEPGDIVTLTMASMGLSQWPVKITSVEEDGNFMVHLEAEEFPYGVGSAIQYELEMPVGTGVPNMFAGAPSVNTPAIFEPPTSIAGNSAQIWIGASGGQGWGGAAVYVSPDGTNYVQAGSIEQASIQGTLTSNLPSHADPDLTNLLSINTTESAKQLSTAVTQAMADDYQTSSIVDTEFMSYGTVTLTGNNTFGLSYLRRGIYGSSPALHNSGAQWTAINPGAVLKYDYPPNYIGKTIYFKLCSFNQFGNGQQSIADATAYPYTITGSAYNIAPPSGINPEVVQYGTGSAIQIYASWLSSPGPNLASYTLQFSTDNGLTWPFTQNIDADTLAGYLSQVQAETNYIARVRANSSYNGNASSWITSTVVNSGNTPISTPAAPTGLTATQKSSSSVTLTWNAPTDTSVTAELLSRAENSSVFGSSSVIATLTPPAASYLDTGLTLGDEYTYWLTDINAAGASNPSSDAIVTLEIQYVTSNGTTVTSNTQTVSQG